MPRMDGTGPEGKGKQTGRGLGKCQKISTEDAFQKLGTGMGQRRQSGGGTGLGRRTKNSTK